MKQIHEEIDKDKKCKDKAHIKRYYYDSKKTDKIVIEQIEKYGKEEKKISEMRIPLENATEKIKEIVFKLIGE